MIYSLGSRFALLSLLVTLTVADEAHDRQMAMRQKQMMMMKRQQAMMQEQRRIMKVAEVAEDLVEEIKKQDEIAADESKPEQERQMATDKKYSMISLGFMNHPSFVKRLKNKMLPGVTREDHSEFIAFFGKQIKQMQMMKTRSDMMLKQMDAKIAMEPHLAEMHKDNISKARIENKALHHSAGQTNAQKFYLEKLLTKKYKDLEPSFKDFMAASSKIDRFNRKDRGETLKKFFLEGEDSVTNEEFLAPWKTVAAGIKLAQEYEPLEEVDMEAMQAKMAAAQAARAGAATEAQASIPVAQAPASSSSTYIIAFLVLALLGAVAYVVKTKQAAKEQDEEDEDDDIENPKSKEETKGEKSNSGKNSSSDSDEEKDTKKKSKKSKKSKTDKKEKKDKKSKSSKKDKKEKKKSKKSKSKDSSDSLKIKKAQVVDEDSEL